MKKILFSIFALSALLVSCSKSEVITAPGADSPIEFNPYIGKAAHTKATADDVDTLKLKGFQTYAFIHAPNGTNYAGDPYMNKVVRYDNDKAKWVYDGNAYWPSTNQLDFIAYGLNAQDANSANITENLTGTAPSITYVVPAVVAQQKDLLVANPQPNQAHDNTSKKVQLHFNLMLSRIAFSLVTKNSNSIPVTITKLQLKGNFYTQGNVDLTAAAPAITQDGQAEVVYDLLPSGSFTHVADGNGVQIYDNSMLYELTGANGEDYSEAEYVEKTFATDEEKAARSKAIQAATVGATEVPYETMQLCMKGLETTAKIVGKSNPNAASDLGVAALNLVAGIKGAYLNVMINLPGIKAEEERARFADAADMVKRAEELGAKIYEEVLASL